MHFNVENNGDTFVASITEKLFQQIVQEEDEYTLNTIEKYVKTANTKGECIAARIIPEGKLRHIINLGLSVYCDRNHLKLNAINLFPQEQYIEYLRRELIKSQEENQQLRNQLNIESE